MFLEGAQDDWTSPPRPWWLWMADIITAALVVVNIVLWPLILLAVIP